MAKIKRAKENEQIHKLNERQFYLLKINNIALNYNTLKEKIISGLLYEICINDLGYAENLDLGFAIDLEADTMELTVTVIESEAQTDSDPLQATE